MKERIRLTSLASMSILLVMLACAVPGKILSAIGSTDSTITPVTVSLATMTSTLKSNRAATLTDTPESVTSPTSTQPTSTDIGIGSYPGPETSGSLQSSPSPSLTSDFLQTSTVTWSAFDTPDSSPTVSPTSTLTPTFTPTPTKTASVTPTAPPWIAAKLIATDPSTVVLSSGKVQLIEFFAYWCGICQAMAPTIAGLQQRYSDRINFIFLDIDDPATEVFKRALGFRIQPHFFLVDAQGVIIKQWTGSVALDTFIPVIEAALQ